MRKSFLFAMAVFYAVCFKLGADEYEFKGTHFLASYLGCDAKALSDVAALRNAMLEAVERSGATLLEAADHVFPPDGYTMVVLLSESHASIHTYPEHGACFIDLFTCGNHCSAKEFDKALREYLKPEYVSDKTFIRERLFEELLN